MFRKDLNSILSGVNKIKNDLIVFVEESYDTLNKNKEKMTSLQGTQEELKKGIDKANKIQVNINEFLGE